MNHQNNLIYDVGMHQGEDTAYYLEKGFKVIAFEANPEMIVYCKKKFEAYINAGQLTIVEGAIVDYDLLENKERKTIQFYRNEVSVWGTVVTDWANRNQQLGTSSELIEVPAVNFADCLTCYGIPYYLKIDIEGMDTVCLKALLPFKEKPSYVSIESEKASFPKLRKEFELFSANGYTSFQLINQYDVPLQKEAPANGEGNPLGYSFEFGSSGLFGQDLRGKWINKTKALAKYKWIFLGYKFLGDAGIVKSKYLKVAMLRFLKLFTKQTIPGWYDTHARHSSVN